MPTALITGASSGLGAEFAWQLARSGHDLVIVARSTDRLEELATQIRAACSVEVEVTTADLATSHGLATVVARLREPDRPIDLLVNNAGYGLGEAFPRSVLARELDALHVMVTSVLALSHAAIEGMIPRKRGAVLNVASVAALMTSGTYSAHKAWVRTFTEGLAGSLRGTGVTATVVNPGLTHTEFHQRAAWTPTGAPEFVWLSAEQVVAEALAAVRAGRASVTPSLRYRAAEVLLRLLPRAVVRRSSRPL